MDAYMTLVEQQVAKAQKEGQFENLKGKGKPMNLKEGHFTSAEENLRNTIYKNNDMLPPEMEMKKKVEELASKLKEGELSLEERKKLTKEKQDAELKYNLLMDTRRRQR